MCGFFLAVFSVFEIDICTQEKGERKGECLIQKTELIDSKIKFMIYEIVIFFTFCFRQRH